MGRHHTTRCPEGRGRMIIEDLKLSRYMNTAHPSIGTSEANISTSLYQFDVSMVFRVSIPIP